MSGEQGSGPAGAAGDDRSVEIRRLRQIRHRYVDLLTTSAVGADPVVGLQLVVDETVDAVRARRGILVVVDPAGSVQHILCSRLTSEQAAQVGSCPRCRALLDEVLERAHPVRIAGVEAHPSDPELPARHPDITSFLGVPVVLGKDVRGGLFVADRADGASFDRDDESLAEAFAAAATVTLVNSQRQHALRERERWLGANYDLAQQLLTGTDPDDQLAGIIRTARQFADAEFAALFVPDESRQHIIVRSADGAEAQQAVGHATPIAGSLAGDVLTTGLPVAIDDMSRNFGSAPWMEGNLPRLGPATLIPLGLADRAIGVILVARLAGRPPFLEIPLRMLESFASQAAVTLHLARERTWREELSFYTDRERIAHDLHDQVIQRVFATGMLLQGTVRLAPRPEIRDRLNRAVRELDETVRQIRTTIYELESPAETAGEDVRTALLAVTDQAGAALGFTPVVRFVLPTDRTLPEPVRDQLVAVARELLTNVARHAGATRVEVELRVDGDVLLRVVDNGVGMPGGERRSGLRNLAERASSRGGELVVGTRPEGGTEAAWRIPLASA
ncbi:MAG: GAF domain-containing protein [Actinocatenispora sp.]